MSANEIPQICLTSPRYPKRRIRRFYCKLFGCRIHSSLISGPGPLCTTVCIRCLAMEGLFLINDMWVRTPGKVSE